MKSVLLMLMAIYIARVQCAGQPVRLEIADLKGIIGSSNFRGKFPETVLDSMELTPTTSLKVAFSVLKSGSFFQPQQVVLMLQSKSADLAAYFSADVKDGMFKASVTTRDIAMKLGTLGGMFEVSIIVGHPAVAGGTQWVLGEIHVQYEPREDGSQPPTPALPSYLKPIKKKPEIVHQHRPPQSEASLALSIGFTIMDLVPLFVLIYVLMVMDRDSKKVFPTGMGRVWAILFHGGIASILLLCLVFWAKLNLLQTLLPMTGLSLFCFITGHRALSAISSSKTKPKLE